MLKLAQMSAGCREEWAYVEGKEAEASLAHFLNQVIQNI